MPSSRPTPTSITDTSAYRAAAAHSSPTNAEDVATNIADFAAEPQHLHRIPGPRGRPELDRRRGRRRLLQRSRGAQVNYLSDNDVATQVSSSSHYNLVGGHNEQGNLALIYDGSIQYDLIIIKGSYHGLNVIFQNNILLNDDKIVMSADGADPSQSVNSGDNA
jgi:hypothetical protein